MIQANRNCKLSCRYLVEQMKKREGFHLLRDVSKYLKHTEKDELFVPCKIVITCLCLSPCTARVCECMLLVYTTQYEGEGRKCRLPEQTGKSKFLSYISGLGTERLKTPWLRCLIPCFYCTHNLTVCLKSNSMCFLFFFLVNR